jgi:serine/threonine-protein kinase HipA
MTMKNLLHHPGPGFAIRGHGFFRLNKERALKIIEQIKKSVSVWRNVANKYKLSKPEQEMMANAFDRFYKK